MTREQFCERLRQSLLGLPQVEISKTLNYYAEIIDDRMEEGMSEDAAVAGMEPVDMIAARVMADHQSSMPPKRSLSGLQITLILLGFPLWFPLMVVAACLGVVILALMWVIVLAVWGICLGLFAGGVAAILNPGFVAVQAGDMNTMLRIGMSLAAVGLSVFVFYGARGAVALAAGATESLAKGIKGVLMKRGGQ